jgi:hypothetical protein
MAGAGNDDGLRVGQHAPRQRRASRDQINGSLWPGHHDLEVITTAQNAGLAGNDDDGTGRFGLVQSAIERCNQLV